MSMAYVCFHTVRIHINDHEEISNENKKIQDGHLLRQWNHSFPLFIHFLLDAIRSTMRCTVTSK